MLIDSDLPYLEPLLLHLRNDPSLKEHFTETSFFMPRNHMIAAIKEAMDKECPAPRALWIFPSTSTAIGNPKAGCRPTQLHSFYITVFIQCMGNSFDFVKRDSGIILGGGFMELTTLRKAVKKSVLEFSKKSEHNKFSTNVTYENLQWVGDDIVYPDDENSFLGVTLEYTINLL